MNEAECCLRKHLDQYLNSQDAIDDFEALRQADPGKAMIDALERKHGKPKETHDVSGTIAGTLMLEQIRKEWAGLGETKSE